MFLVCDKITHLHRLSISWSYDQALGITPKRSLGGTSILLQRFAEMQDHEAGKRISSNRLLAASLCNWSSILKLVSSENGNNKELYQLVKSLIWFCF